jgi:hypothetical protein
LALPLAGRNRDERARKPKPVHFDAFTAGQSSWLIGRNAWSSGIVVLRMESSLGYFDFAGDFTWNR